MLSTDRAVRRWRLALCVLQCANGLLISSWISRTPEIRDALHVTTALMGLVLTGLSVGSMAGVVASAGLVRRRGGSVVLISGICCSWTGVTIVAGAVAAGSAPMAFLGLTLFGWGYGSQEVAVNIEASTMETITCRPALPLVYGSFSLGTVAGALIGIGAVAASVPLPWHLVTIVLATGLAVGAIARWIPEGTGRDDALPAEKSGRSRSARRHIWRDRGLLCIAIFVLGIALAEGAAYDWLPLIFVDGYGLEALYGAVMFAVFAMAMTIGRFSGTFILTRFSRIAVMRTCVAAAVIGLVAVVFAPNAYVAVLALVLWALGSALGGPVAVSVAADDAHQAMSRVAVISVTSYVAFLVGPPLLGVVGQAWGIRDSMLVVVVFLTAAGVATLAVPPESRASAQRAARK